MRFHPHQLSPQYQALPKNNSVGFFANIISFGLWLLVFGAWGYFAANFLNTPILTTLPASIGVVLLFFTGFAYWPFMFLGQAILLSTQSHAWAINFVLLFATYIDFLFITYALNQLYREPNLNQIAAQTLYRLLLPCIFSFLFFICVTWSVNAATQKQTYHFSVWTFFSILLLIGVLERVLVFSILYRFLYERSRLKGRSLTFLFATFSFIYGFFLKNILGYSPVWVYTLFLLIPVGIIPFVSTLANSTWASLALVLGITTAMCIHPVNTKAALESNINLIALLLLMALLQNGFAIIRTTFNALRHQENKINQKVRQVLNIAPVLVCSYNQQGHFFFWNEECERILGWSLQEVQTKNTPHQLFPAKPSQKDDTFPNSEKDKTFQIRKIKNKHGTIKSILWGSFQVAPDRYFGIGIHVTPKTQAALKLEKTRQHYQQILKNLPIGIFTLRLSPKGQYIFDYVNPFFSDTLGLSTKQIQHNPEIVLSLWKKGQGNPKTLAAAKRAFKFGRGFCIEEHILINHQLRWLKIEFNTTVKENGQKIANGVLIDITEEKQRVARLNTVNLAIQEMQDGLIILDKQRNIVQTNPAIQQLTGYQNNELIHQPLSQFLTQHTYLGAADNIWRTVNKQGAWQGEITFYTKKQEKKFLHVFLSQVKTSIPQTEQYIIMLSDITPFKAREEKLVRLAYFDSLTGLATRRLLYDRLQQAIRYTMRNQQLLAVCYLDLDDFKDINDMYGHKGGDQLLTKFAHRLKRQLRQNDTAARMGGDEIVIILPNLKQHQDGVRIIERITDSITQPYELLGRFKVQITASIGVYFYDTRTHPLNEPIPEGNTFIQRADQAMYIAKAKGDNNVHYKY